MNVRSMKRALIGGSGRAMPVRSPKPLTEPKEFKFATADRTHNMVTRSQSKETVSDAVSDDNRRGSVRCPAASLLTFSFFLLIEGYNSYVCGNDAAVYENAQAVSVWAKQGAILSVSTRLAWGSDY